MIFCKFQIVFHGISTNKEEIVLDGSEAPIRIDAEALLSLENLAPAAVLNKVRVAATLIHFFFEETTLIHLCIDDVNIIFHLSSTF